MKKHYFLSKILGFNDLTFSCSVILKDQGEISLDYSEIIGDNDILLHAENELFSDDISFIVNGTDVTAKRTFINKSGQVLKVKELAVKLVGFSFGLNAKDDFFYHTENTRIYENFTFPIDYVRTADDASNSEFDVQAGNQWQDPGVVQERIGASPYQPFPAILISNYNSRLGLVHGTLSQDVFYHNYLVRHGNKIELDIYSSFKLIEYREVKNEEPLIDEWYIGITNDSNDIEKIFSGYTKFLRKKLPINYGSTSINRDNMIWGSWNDGIFRDVSEELLVLEAKALKKHFPTVHWVQLDDGYSVTCDNIANGLGVPYEGEAGIDAKKFPNGLRSLTDKIREIGLRPALWIGGFCPTKTKIFIEHPEWFLDYTYRVTATEPLDVSQIEVRDYMTKALDKLVVEYGFDGIKHDFWSYAFEDSHDLYKNKDKSGYEYRKWWVEEMRKRIPKDGYLQSCCDIAMANPFLGEQFTNYRYGDDIASGAWHSLKVSFLWGTACFALHTGDLFVPNSDSIGPLKALPDNEFMFWTNFVLITRSGVELAGRFSQDEVVNSDRFDILTKACCNPNNGQDCYFVNLDYRKPGYTTPDAIYLKTPLFTNEGDKDFIPLRTVGLFNLEERKKTFSIKLSDLGLDDGKYILTDVWTGKRLRAGKEYKTTLKKHSSRIITISKRVKNSIIDADIRMLNVEKNKKTITFETDYAKQAKITLFGTPKSVKFDGKDIEYIFNNGILSLFVPGKGKIQINFN